MMKNQNNQSKRTFKIRAQLNEAISKTSDKMLQDGIESDWVAGAFSLERIAN